MSSLGGVGGQRPPTRLYGLSPRINYGVSLIRGSAARAPTAHFCAPKAPFYGGVWGGALRPPTLSYSRGKSSKTHIG